MTTITAIAAAQMEARGEGAFRLAGRTIKFNALAYEFSWNCRTPKDAAQQLRIFRAAPKHVGA